MDELTLDNKKYLSSKKAASVTGYAKDYVGQLCREGRIEARLVGRNWYVLESALLAHRFGTQEETTPSAEQTLVAAPGPVIRPWEAPRYVSEPIETLPEMTPKPVPQPAESSKVLLDMQSAWKEWFEQQEGEEKSLPDASAMLLADHEEVRQPSDYEEASPQLPQNNEEIQVHILRTHEEPFIEAPRPSIERMRPVEMQRAGALDEPVATRSLIGREREEAKKARPQKLKARRYKQKGGNSFVLKALLISITGLAIVIAVIGSGIADNFIPTKGVGTFITDFISGTQIIK